MYAKYGTFKNIGLYTIFQWMCTFKVAKSDFHLKINNSLTMLGFVLNEIQTAKLVKNSLIIMARSYLTNNLKITETFDTRNLRNL